MKSEEHALSCSAQRPRRSCLHDVVFCGSVFSEETVDFADISRFKCPALIRAKPNSHKILQSHTFIITLHGYMYNSLQYHNRILKFSLFNTKGLFPDPPNPQKLTKTRRNYSATSH